jgi:hypothetical protein
MKKSDQNQLETFARNKIYRHSREGGSRQSSEAYLAVQNT